MEKKNKKIFVICFLPWVLIGPFNVQYIKVQFQVIPETYRVVRYLTDESAHFEKKKMKQCPNTPIF
jgi:hypothetical protein